MTAQEHQLGPREQARAVAEAQLHGALQGRHRSELVVRRGLAVGRCGPGAAAGGGDLGPGAASVQQVLGVLEPAGQGLQCRPGLVQPPGLHVLADAYHRLRHKPNAPPTRLLAAGYLLNEHRDYLSSSEQRLRDWGLASEFTYAGAPDRAGKIAMIRQMDLFSVPAVYAEPKGLSLLEAMANGVPIVQPRRGAFTEIAQRTGGGVLVAPDEPEALADALLALLLDRDRAAALGRAGAEGVKQQYSVDQMAHAAEKVYGELHARPVRA